jgi:hypothetical protein
MGDPNRFAIIPIYSDSTGCAAIPENAVMHGDWCTVTGRIRDSRQQRQMLTLINDAEHAKSTLKAIRAREDSLKAAEDSFATDVDIFRDEQVQDFINKLDALTHRMDSIEADEAKDPDDETLSLPPGYARRGRA